MMAYVPHDAVFRGIGWCERRKSRAAGSDIDAAAFAPGGRLVAF